MTERIVHHTVDPEEVAHLLALARMVVRLAVPLGFELGDEGYHDALVARDKMVEALNADELHQLAEQNVPYGPARLALRDLDELDALATERAAFVKARCR